MTRAPLSRSKGQGHQAALLTAVLARQAAAAVGVTMLAVGKCCYVAVCSAAQSASAPTGEERSRGIPWRPPAYSLYVSAATAATATATAAAAAVAVGSVVAADTNKGLCL